ncbi:MAG TPA: efflux RND transporter periplasmic adaptor subunit [Opitutaceae bacterium]|jgi:multidrug efflux system membrane fusion protein|nr:efflux RND transporter periplasmic adaptor subunit [Opitutaceae bacterium]
MNFLRGATALVFTSFILLFVSACGGDGAEGDKSAVPVTVAQVKRQSVPVNLNSIGTVQSLRAVIVKSQVDGVIEQIHFREGDDVKAGDLLVTLDRRPFENNLSMAQADLATARAQAEHADADVQRYKPLDEQAMVSKDTYTQLVTTAETAKATVQAKEAALANAQLQLSYTEIRAPIDGHTGQLQLHEGALVKANDTGFPLFTVNQLAPISVAYSVPESYLDRVRQAYQAGEKIAVTAVGADSLSKKVSGTLEFIDNSVDSTTGTILLKATFANTAHDLWPGELVNIDTRLGLDADSIVIPAPAVENGQNGTQVFVVKPDQTVELRSVKVARTIGNLTVIADGLKEGETVVTDGQLRLVPGAHIEVRPLAASDAAKGKS